MDKKRKWFSSDAKSLNSAIIPKRLLKAIDGEVNRLVKEAYDQSIAILTQYRDKLDAIANRLLEVETISKEEFEEIFPAPVEKKSGTPMLLSATE